MRTYDARVALERVEAFEAIGKAADIACSNATQGITGDFVVAGEHMTQLRDALAQFKSVEQKWAPVVASLPPGGGHRRTQRTR